MMILSLSIRLTYSATRSSAQLHSTTTTQSYEGWRARREMQVAMEDRKYL
ncbi:MAG: hypothetical protein IPO42_10930 [Chitinophagaceae bacterium]|nr:hypothetical protein [Chitinophagaceae bacterium]